MGQSITEMNKSNWPFVSISQRHTHLPAEYENGNSTMLFLLRFCRWEKDPGCGRNWVAKKSLLGERLTLIVAVKNFVGFKSSNFADDECCITPVVSKIYNLWEAAAKMGAGPLLGASRRIRRTAGSLFAG